MKSLISTLVLIFVSQSFAGGWISSGGELFRDAKNPWFVRNTQNVTYCIKVEDEGFSASLNDIEATVKEGISYWKDEFSRAQNMGSDGTFQVATQSFQQVACNPTVDIEFLFGYKTLSAEQIKYLKDPKKFIGVTVRTEYDLKNLKAKGFIFFSSDYGPNAYDNVGNLVEKAWSRPKILKYAILHELGHVFGISHMGAGLMAEVFLNQMLNKSMVENYEKFPIESFFRPSQDLELCLPESTFFLNVKWFGASTDKNCIEISSPSIVGTWKVYGKKDKNSPREDVGEIRNVQPNNADLRLRPATILELGDEQKVFTGQEAVFRSYMMGPMLMEMGFSGIYVSAATKKPMPVYISMTPTSLSIQGNATTSKIEPVFIFNSPISILFITSPKP